MFDEPLHGTVHEGFLRSLPREAVERLLADAIRIQVPAGSVVYRDGESPSVLVVVDGLLRVFLTSEEGRQVTVRYARRGDVVGLVLVLSGPAPTNVQAMTTSSVVALEVETVRSLIASDPDVAKACAEELTRQLHQAFDDISQHAFLTVRQRVARQLLDLASPGRARRLVAPVSQQELADAVGSVREVVGRTLLQLKDEGLVERSEEGVVLLDPVRLSEEASGSEASGSEAS